MYGEDERLVSIITISEGRLRPKVSSSLPSEISFNMRPSFIGAGVCGGRIFTQNTEFMCEDFVSPLLNITEYLNLP